MFIPFVIFLLFVRPNEDGGPKTDMYNRKLLKIWLAYITIYKHLNHLINY